MRVLIPEYSWMQNTVGKEEAEKFNPALGPCCDTTQFRVHLEGTPCNNWNKSATSVFVNEFLKLHHSEFPSQEEVVQKMVELKTRAAIESMIRGYRKSKEAFNKAEQDEAKARKNRRERQRKVSSSACVALNPRRE
jgi:hypothetical protein